MSHGRICTSGVGFASPPRRIPCFIPHINLDFLFDHLLDSPPGSSDAVIHAGLNAMKTFRSTKPNG